MQRISARLPIMFLALILCAIVNPLKFASAAEAQNTTAGKTAEAEKTEKKDSPWMVIPLVSSNPKLDTSLGAMGAYIHRFDEKSRVSMFGLSAQYTTSDSTTVGLFARTSFGEDYHRIVSGLVYGNINNDYQNYLDTGEEVETQDQLKSGFFRYTYRVFKDFFVGGQAAYTNYQLVGRNSADDEILDDLGLVGYKSGGIGLVLFNDTRDNDFKTTRGWYLNANNMSYREALAGESNFDIYRIDLRFFIPQGGGNVLGIRQRNQLSVNAPAGAMSPIYLRGYTPGETLAQNMSSLEAEERFALTDKFTATVFAGVAYMYGDGADRLERPDYPAAGLGLQYILKAQAGIVANVEVAAGRGSDNQAFYLKMGYDF